jgi:hypothetical protein
MGLANSVWFSVVLLVVSLWIRVSMKESRAYLHAKLHGKLSPAPLREVFGKKENRRKLPVALGGMVDDGGLVYVAILRPLFPHPIPACRSLDRESALRRCHAGVQPILYCLRMVI